MIKYLASFKKLSAAQTVAVKSAETVSPFLVKSVISVPNATSPLSEDAGLWVLASGTL